MEAEHNHNQPEGEQQGEQQHADEQPTSLAYQKLQDAFQRMVAVGIDVADEQDFCRVMSGVPEPLVWPMWELYQRVIANVVNNALGEFEDLAAEVGLAQQLADLEALALQRGMGAPAAGGGGGDSTGDDPSAGPSAAAAAARVAAKRAEKQQLQEMLGRAQRQRDDLQSRVDARRKAVEGAKAAYERAAGQMAEVHAVVGKWHADGVLPATVP